MSDDKKYTIPEVAKLLGVDASTVWRRANKKNIGQRIGKASRIFTKEDVKKLRVG